MALRKLKFTDDVSSLFDQTDNLPLIDAHGSGLTLDNPAVTGEVS